MIMTALRTFSILGDNINLQNELKNKTTRGNEKFAHVYLTPTKIINFF